MQVKKNIRHIVLICFWLLAGTGLVVLLVAAVNSRSQQLCRGYDIDINGEKEGEWFLDRNDILKVITQNRTMSIRNRAVKSFDLNRIEAELEREQWVKDAELYFNNSGILKVKVTERQPIARIFTAGGESFYIDSAGKKLSLSAKMSARLPVFTSYPYAQKKTTPAGEKKLIRQIRDMSMYLQNDPFWMAQIAQIDITPSREFEMVPTVGNHLIEFGDARNKEDKFQRLLVFYRQVLSKTGMEKYERIKVQYDRQVIGVKKENNNN